ncbi:MAG: hypothetical protein JNL35_12250 [Sphingopyxis sp.]|nr:hypothetical protein [Sphingopyxis sp.]
MARSRPKQHKPAKVSFEPPTISDDLLDGILLELGLPEPADQGRAKRNLVAHVNAFALGRYVEANTQTVHEDVHLAREIAALVDSLRDEASRFLPMTSLAINVRFSELTGDKNSLRKLTSDLNIYRGMLATFGEA